MYEYEPLCTILDITVDEFYSDETLNYDGIVPATKHHELDDLNKQSTGSHFDLDRCNYETIMILE